MKKTKIQRIPYSVPNDICTFLSGASIYDSSCSPEARVYFIDKDEGYYLKRALLGTLSTEAKMTEYFYTLGLGAEVLFYASYPECDWLMTRRVRGEDCTHEKYLSSPKQLAIRLGEELRALHELDFSACPVYDRMESYFALAEKNYLEGKFDKSFLNGNSALACADEAYSFFTKHKSALSDRSLLHGDYCLPNIMLNDWRLSGFIDLGGGGVGDRHIDIFWGAWTLRYNTKEDKYKEYFFDAYGRDKINGELLDVIAAAEAFG